MHAPNESKRRPGALRAGFTLLVAAAALPGTVLADWESVPTVRLGAEGNDNPRLGQDVPGPGELTTPLDDYVSTRTFLDARLEVTNTGPSGSFSIEPRVSLDAYQDDVDDELERDDVYLTARGLRRGIRTETRIDASLSRESILSSELVGTDFTDDPGDAIGEPLDTDTGLLVLLDEDVETFSLTPAADFKVSQRASVGVQLDHLDTSYTGPQFIGRTDFKDTGLMLNYNRATSARAEAGVSLLVSKFSADLTDNTTDTVGIEGGYQAAVNDLWSINVLVGVERSTFDFLAGPGAARRRGDDTNFTFGAGLDRRSERGNLTLDIGRSVGPNGSGFLSQRADVRALYRWQMTQRVRGGIGFTHRETETIGSTDDQRDYTRLDLDFEWALSTEWGLSVGWSALDQEFASDLASGQANVLSLSAVYRGLRRPSTGPR